MDYSNKAGFNRETGQLLYGIDHVHQSIIDILTTPTQSRIMRPEYGSDIFKLIDKPINPRWLVDFYYEAVVSIHRWEPRVRVRRIIVKEVSLGRVVVDLQIKLKNLSDTEWLRAITIQF